MTTERLRELLAAIARVRTLVVGDAMVDEYVWGRAERVSPEAPVLVVRCERETQVPGGAANVVHCIQALKASVGLCAVVGQDAAAELLRARLRELRVDPVVLLADPHRPTTVKTRVVAGRQQVLRIDREERAPLSAALANQFDQAVEAALPGRQGLLLSDYDKGVLTPLSIPGLLRAARRHELRVAVNAKPRHAAAYRGVGLLTVNRLEAEAIAGHPADDSERAAKAATEIQTRLDCEAVLVTLGAQGAVLREKGGTVTHVPAVAVEVFDPAGAGDTTIAAAHLALCAGSTPHEAAELAMLAAAVVVRKVGVATATPEEVLAMVG
ncbi:MAG: bifunctional hydroxymethylpyrimidine kinase/phosphomethylpyrimidine kinase [Armatimonadetes bacterium]|nr:bifunctional hydroxymethylpyrimidine kinase/phosphomethylpyrimidine kinase [Armatimonadota bacterium]